jgi:hypothetical protein
LDLPGGDLATVFILAFVVNRQLLWSSTLPRPPPPLPLLCSLASIADEPRLPTITTAVAVAIAATVVPVVS